MMAEETTYHHQRRLLRSTLSHLRPTVQSAHVAGPVAAGPPHGGNAHRPTVTGVHGMVACAHPLAAQAGMQLLMAGGNAIDAGVAVAAALNVVEPFMSGVGGGGFMQINTATGEHAACDYAGTIPAAADFGRFYDGQPDNANCGPLSVLVPGSAAGWLAVLERFGSKTAAEVFAPAIQLAEVGFALTKKGGEFFQSSFEVLDESPWPFRDASFSAVESTYLQDGQPPPFGAVLRQPELAQTLRTLSAEGPDAFYRGKLAEQMVAHIQKTGGLLTLEDFASYEPVWVTPVSTTYRGTRVSCLPPPNLGVQILEALNILEGYPLSEWGHNDERTLHCFIEVKTLCEAAMSTISLCSSRFRLMSASVMLVADIRRRQSLQPLTVHLTSVGQRTLQPSTCWTRSSPRRDVQRCMNSAELGCSSSAVGATCGMNECVTVGFLRRSNPMQPHVRQTGQDTVHRQMQQRRQRQDGWVARMHCSGFGNKDRQPISMSLTNMGMRSVARTPLALALARA